MFGFLGSFSVFDGGMAGALKDTGIPDVGYSLGVDRQALTNNFSPQPLRPGWRTGALQYYKAKYPDVVEHVGAIYGDVPSARDAYNGEKAAMESLGYKFVYENSYEPAQTDFSADVVRMRANGVKMLIMTGDVNSMARVAQELKNQNYSLTLANYGGNAYDPAFIKLAGNDAAEGALLDQSLVMYSGEDRGTVPEADLFLTWLNKLYPGYQPDIFAAYSWAAGRLFIQAAEAAGPKLTRAGLLAALSKIDNFDDFAMLAPAGPASKRPASCYILIRVHDGKFLREDSPGSGFRCDGDFYYKRQT